MYLHQQRTDERSQNKQAHSYILGCLSKIKATDLLHRKTQCYMYMLFHANSEMHLEANGPKVEKKIHFFVEKHQTS